MKSVALFLLATFLLLSACTNTSGTSGSQQPDDSQPDRTMIDFSQGVPLSDDDFRFYNTDSSIEVENSNDMSRAYIRIEIGENERYKTYRGIGRGSTRDDVLSMYSKLDFSISKQRDFEGNYPYEIITYSAEQGELIFMINERDAEVKHIGIKSYVQLLLEQEVMSSDDRILGVDIRSSALQVDIDLSNTPIPDFHNVALEITKNVIPVVEKDNNDFVIFVNLVDVTSNELIRKSRWPLATGDKDHITTYYYNNAGMLETSLFNFSQGVAVDRDDVIGNGNTDTGSTNNPTLGELNALSHAKSYLDYTSFSQSGLIKQLEFEGYTTEEATYAVNNVGADWNEQAARMAQAYLDYSSFSRQGLFDQLVFEGFTRTQAEYGVTAVGY